MRPDGRKPGDLRPISLTRGVAEFAEGSCLARFGTTAVHCTATVERQTPRWRSAEDGGWITAEYDMLPRANRERSNRSSGRGGRSQEISRLVGRSLRAAADLKAMPGVTITVDCDVLQGDGGTRVAAVTGGYVALADALRWCLEKQFIKGWPLTDSIAGVSVGLVDGRCVLDLCYEEDAAASVDGNFVFTGAGRLVEVQISGEEASFTEDEMNAMLALARRGVARLTRLQRDALGPLPR
jgi:ribonuclease PH